MKSFLYCLALAASIIFSSTGLCQQFTDGQAADAVLGQVDFDSAATGTGASQLNTPRGVVRDPATGKVFVSDALNHRILRYASAAAAGIGGAAEFVFGQPDFSSTSANQGGAPSATTLSAPSALALDALGRLWVADSSNHRVLCYPSAASVSSANPAATIVLGQPDFATVSLGITSTKMNLPAGLAVAPGDRLWVLDSQNHRAIRFEGLSLITSGAAASGVLGQLNLNSNAVAFANSTTFAGATGISVDSTGRLWVANFFSNRVLRFDNAAAKSNGAAADGVLGQVNFSAFDPAGGAAGLNFPIGVLALDNGELWVVDRDNHRLLRYENAAAKANGDPADGVLGQPDFTQVTFGTSATTLRSPRDLAEGPDDGLLLTDELNHRVLRYTRPVPPLPPAPLLSVLTKNGVSKKAKTVVRGTASGTVTAVKYRVGTKGAFRTAAGTASWSFKASLKPGKNKISVFAEGPGGVSATRLVVLKRK